MKNFASVLTGFVLALTVSVGVYAAEDCSPWAKESIDKAISEGIVPETLQSDYTSNITRKEFCRLAVQTYIKKTGYTTQEYLQTPFTDIDDDYVTTAYMLEIVSGKGNEKFDPDSAITRQEAAVMLNNLAEVSGVDNNKTNTEKFVDEDHFASWAKDAIYKISAVKNGGTAVMSGTGSGKFSPWMNYTREQAIATMYRLYECSSIPVLIPQKDKNIYRVSRDYNVKLKTSGYLEYILCIDCNTKTAKRLFEFDQRSSETNIVAISGDWIYCICQMTSGEKYVYKIKTDGTEDYVLTPAAHNIYIGHKYIYYVPSVARNIVVRTDLNGKNPITVDYSKIHTYGKYPCCYIKGDKNDNVYIYVQLFGGNYPLYNDIPEDYPVLYEYDYTTEKAQPIDLYTNTDPLIYGTLCDGKYKYYPHREIHYAYRNMGHDELRRCNIDGTDDIAFDDLFLTYDSYMVCSNCMENYICMYKDRLYMAEDLDTALCVTELTCDGVNRRFYPLGEDSYDKYTNYRIKFLGVIDNKLCYYCVNRFDNIERVYSYDMDSRETKELSWTK